jgi:heme/copper-type cytochrome/quinol oxidase subunit 2
MPPQYIKQSSGDTAAELDMYSSSTLQAVYIVLLLLIMLIAILLFIRRIKRNRKSKKFEMRSLSRVHGTEAFHVDILPDQQTAATSI